MNDRYLDFSHSEMGKRLMGAIGMSSPPKLKRSGGAVKAKSLHHKSVLVGCANGGTAIGDIITTLNDAGADLLVRGDFGDADVIGQHLRDAGVRASTLVPNEQTEKFYAAILDVTGIANAEDLDSLYEFFHPVVKKIAANGRVLVIGRTPEAIKNTATRTAQRAIEGFTRSLAKELGGKGINVQLLYAAAGAESSIGSPIRYFLSPHSAYVTGQVLRVSKPKAKADYEWEQGLSDKVAVVTGAARGIGAAIAGALAREGAHVICVDRPGEDEALQQVAGPIGGSILTADVTAADTPQRLADYCLEHHGGLDIIVHNAGVTRDKTLGRMKKPLWDMVLDINLSSILDINEVIVPKALRDGGRVICVSSIGGIAGNPGQTNYGATKAGVIGYVDGLSGDLAGRNITVNAVAPGFIETQMTAAMPVGIREAGRRLATLGQGGLPSDIAEVVSFFAHPGSNGVNGNVLRACGQSLIGA